MVVVINKVNNNTTIIILNTTTNANTPTNPKGPKQQQQTNQSSGLWNGVVDVRQHRHERIAVQLREHVVEPLSRDLAAHAGLKTLLSVFGTKIAMLCLCAIK